MAIKIQQRTMGETGNEICLDELFCMTVKEDNKLVHNDIKELLNKIIKQHPNDKELGMYIRRHYGSSKG